MLHQLAHQRKHENSASRRNKWWKSCRNRVVEYEGRMKAVLGRFLQQAMPVNRSVESVCPSVWWSACDILIMAGFYFIPLHLFIRSTAFFSSSPLLLQLPCTLVFLTVGLLIIMFYFRCVFFNETTFWLALTLTIIKCSWPNVFALKQSKFQYNFNTDFHGWNFIKSKYLILKLPTKNENSVTPAIVCNNYKASQG